MEKSPCTALLWGYSPKRRTYRPPSLLQPARQSKVFADATEVVSRLLPFMSKSPSMSTKKILHQLIFMDLADATPARRQESPSHITFRENLFSKQRSAHIERQKLLDAAREDHRFVCNYKALRASQYQLKALAKSVPILPSSTIYQPAPKTTGNFGFFLKVEQKDLTGCATESFASMPVKLPVRCSKLTFSQQAQRVRLRDSIQDLQRQADYGNPIPLLAAQAKLLTLDSQASMFARYRDKLPPHVRDKPKTR